MPRSSHGGRHELGQNFLHHRPTIDRIAELVAATSGPILEIGAGDGALTRALTRLRRRLLTVGAWRHAFLLTQWEVARKRAGIGAGTMMTAQTAPWFAASLHGRVPSRHVTPRPSVDGGILGISRRESPLIPPAQRSAYERFVRAVFTGPGGKLARVVQRAARLDAEEARRALDRASVAKQSLPRDLDAAQWAALWAAVERPRSSAAGGVPRPAGRRHARRGQRSSRR